MIRKELDESMQKMHRAETSVVRGPGIIATMRLKKGFRFIVMGSGGSPGVAPVAEPGTYEIDCQAIKPGVKWPMLICAVPAKHVPAFLKMSVDQVDALVADAILVAGSSTKIQ